MKYTRDELRRPATIRSVFQGQEDHGIWTVDIALEGPGWGQCFGNLCLQDKAEAKRFLQEVCGAFGLADPEGLIGRRCVALYSVSPWDSIEGIEAPSGKRFTIRGYRKRHYPDHAPTPTEERRDALERRIEALDRQLSESRAELEALGTLIDWDEEPSAP